MSDAATKLLRLPGTYPAQHDTWLLADVLRRSRMAEGRRVLDVCTGTGALAVVAADAGAASVDAVDLSWRSVLSARANSSLRRAGVVVHRGDLFQPVTGQLFDLVLANPPYVPAATDVLPRYSIGRCWDGGVDGRRLVDRICDGVRGVLAPGGRLLLVQSCVTGEQQTLDRLRSVGLRPQVVARAVIPFGPVMRARATMLRSRRLLAPEAQGEEVLVVVASAPAVADLSALGRAVRFDRSALREAA